MAKRKSSGCALKEQLWFGANLRPPSVEFFGSVDYFRRIMPVVANPRTPTKTFWS